MGQHHIDNTNHRSWPEPDRYASEEASLAHHLAQNPSPPASLSSAPSSLERKVSHHRVVRSDPYHPLSQPSRAKDNPNSVREERSRGDVSNDRDENDTVDLALFLEQLETNEANSSLSFVNTTSRPTKLRRESKSELPGNGNETEERVRHEFDSLEKRLRRKQARVYLLKTSVEEQATFGRIKRDEAASIHTDLKLEFRRNPPGSASFDIEKTMELITSWEIAYAQTQRAEKTLDPMIASLTRQEKQLQEVADRALNRMIGEPQFSPFSADDLFDADFDKSSTSSSSPASAHSPRIAEVEEIQVDADASDIDWPPSAYNNHASEEDDDYEYRTVVSQSTRYGYMNNNTTVKQSPTSRLNGHAGDLSGRTLTNGDVSLDPETCDFYTLDAGNQFQRDQEDIEKVKEDSLSEMEANTHVRLTRKDDPVVLINALESTAYDNLKPIEIPVIYTTEPQNLSNLIGRWIVQLFTCSWLELSRFVPLVSEKIPVIETVVMVIGYINLDILVREKWNHDDVDVESRQMRSIMPSIASVSDDLPTLFRHIYIGSDKARWDPRYFQDGRGSDGDSHSLGSHKPNGSVGYPPSLTSEILSHPSMSGTPPYARTARANDESPEPENGVDDDYYAESDEKTCIESAEETDVEPLSDDHTDSANAVYVQPTHEVYIDPRELHEQYYKSR